MQRKVKKGNFLSVLLTVGLLLFPLFFPTTVNGTAVYGVETQGNIGFTGSYEPIGNPDPIPPEGMKPPETIETAKPSGSLPKTNAVPMIWLFWLGIGILCYVFILWKQQRKQQTKNN